MSSDRDRQAFYARLAETLQMPGGVSDATPLGPGTWDSLVLIGTIALIDQTFGRTVRADALKTCTSAGDLWRLAAGEPRDVA